ncbi:MAG: roadblock/LC7 domain-containing protein [Acidimicrobiales bacterium]|nr:roadblock/LC7 domain-containing protein [Acidimicrobiales bacterium]
MITQSVEAQAVAGAIDGFVAMNDGIHEAILVSHDGLPVSASAGIDRNAADRFAAVSSGLIGLAYGASARFQGGHIHEVIVEMEQAFLLVTGIPDGSSLAVFADVNADLGTVGYEMAMLSDDLGQVLTPAIRAELQQALLR